MLGPLQITKGGAILITQLENEYGSYRNDSVYMGKLRQVLEDAGFDVPLFACNPVYQLHKGVHSDIFNVVNFGKNAESACKKLRKMQPKGPLMCGEFYPGWFDTWGAPHHTGRRIACGNSAFLSKPETRVSPSHSSSSPRQPRQPDHGI